MRIHPTSASLLAVLVALLPACSSKTASTGASLTPPFLDTPIAPRLHADLLCDAARVVATHRMFIPGD
jgi:hypothetical protein